MLLRKKNYTVAAIVAIAIMGSASYSSVKAETIDNSPATAVVVNAITWSETTPLHFGTLVVTSDGTQTSSSTIDTAGAISYAITAPSNIFSVSATSRSQGVFALSTGAISTNLNLTYGNYVNMDCTACSGTNPELVLSGAVEAGGAVFALSAAGAGTMNLGVTLTTQATANAYEDGTYVGSFDITMAY